MGEQNTSTDAATRSAVPHAPGRSSRRAAFTLIELLVVVAIVALLVGILVPTLKRSRFLVDRTRCASNMHQWGQAIAAYAAGNKMSFPDNTDGFHISWCGLTVQRFWGDYLVGWQKMHVQGGDDVIYCPTQLWHRTDVAIAVDNAARLTGYFYMPYRDPNNPYNGGVDYSYAGLKWVTKKKLSEFPRSPILSDMKQYASWIPSWFYPGSGPIASHIQPSGEPYGGNFLFEDGHVRWYDTQQMDLGVAVGSWWCSYKIPDIPAQ